MSGHFIKTASVSMLFSSKSSRVDPGADGMNDNRSLAQQSCVLSNASAAAPDERPLGDDLGPHRVGRPSRLVRGGGHGQAQRCLSLVYFGLVVCKALNLHYFQA